MRIDEIKLAVIMAKKRLNITQLAKLSGVSRQTITYAKAGKRVKVDIVAKLAVALNVDVTDIIE